MRVDKIASNFEAIPHVKKPLFLNKTELCKSDLGVTQLLKSMGVYNMPLVKGSDTLADISFDKGIAKNLHGGLYSGTIKDTLKNGKNIELTYLNGRWEKSRISQNGTSYMIDKIANYDKNNQLSRVDKIYIQNNEPVMAKVTKYNDYYTKAERYFDVDTTKFKPVTKGQKLSESELDRCFKADFFKGYNPEKYTGSGIIEEDKSRVLKANRTDGKWVYQGVVDNLQRLMDTIKG